jgi:hypothetical protein
MVNYLSPLQRIVNVGWGGFGRYMVVGIADNTSEALVDIAVPILPTTLTMVSPSLDVLTVLTTSASQAGDEWSANTTLDEDKGNADAVNSIEKRKALVDASETYWFVTYQAWKYESGLDIVAASIVYYFMLGRYALDHPNTSHFFFDASPIFGPSENMQWDRPLSAANIPRAQDWSKPLDDLDGGPFDRTP